MSRVLVTEPVKAPIRHRIYFRVEAVLYRHLLGMLPGESRYVCSACLKLDHEHCEGASGRWSLCQCDDPDLSIHVHAHPHDPSRYWPYPGATKPVEGEYDPELAEVYAYADELAEADIDVSAFGGPMEERLHVGAKQ